MDTKVKLVELLINGLDRRVILCVLNGFIFCRGEYWYLYECGDRMWTEGKMSSTCSKLLCSLVEEYEKKLFVFVNCSCEEIVGFAKEIGIVVNTEGWVSLSNGMCYREMSNGDTEFTVYLSGGEYWDAGKSFSIYDKAGIGKENCESLFSSVGWDPTVIDSFCCWN